MKGAQLEVMFAVPFLNSGEPEVMFAVPLVHVGGLKVALVLLFHKTEVCTEASDTGVIYSCDGTGAVIGVYSFPVIVF